MYYQNLLYARGSKIIMWLSNEKMIYTMDQWLWLITLKSDIQGRQSIYCYQLKTCHNRCLYVNKNTNWKCAIFVIDLLIKCIK